MTRDGAMSSSNFRSNVDSARWFSRLKFDCIGENRIYGKIILPKFELLDV